MEGTNTALFELGVALVAVIVVAIVVVVARRGRGGELVGASRPFKSSHVGEHSVTADENRYTPPLRQPSSSASHRRSLVNFGDRVRGPAPATSLRLSYRSEVEAPLTVGLQAGEAVGGSMADAASRREAVAMVVEHLGGQRTLEGGSFSLELVALALGGEEVGRAVLRSSDCAGVAEATRARQIEAELVARLEAALARVAAAGEETSDGAS